MSDIVLYGDPRSPYVRTARMALAEKGVGYTLKPADLKDAAYRRVHPYARMPAMEHGALRVFETAAITRYVDEAFEGPALQPADAGGRARMTQWISAYNDYMARPFGPKLVIERLAPKIFGRPTNEDEIRGALPEVERALDVLDAGLSGDPYLAGATASLADLFVAPMLFYVGLTPEGQERLPRHRALALWFERMRSRPSFAATMPELPG
ncbi:MAG: glutathione S-transferase family protein [Alphaproteobacteria bacterium]